MKLPEITLKRMDASMKPFKWAGEDIGFRNKIGGKPDNIAENDYPLCDSCKNKMTFYGQLDSISDDFIIADCGMISVFLCFDCLETKSIITSG
jgi:hypothetical protein